MPEWLCFVLFGFVGGAFAAFLLTLSFALFAPSKLLLYEKWLLRLVGWRP